MEILERGFIIIDYCLLRFRCNFKGICKTGMANIMAESTKNNSEDLLGSQNSLIFWKIRQQVACMHN